MNSNLLAVQLRVGLAWKARRFRWPDGQAQAGDPAGWCDLKARLIQIGGRLPMASKIWAPVIAGQQRDGDLGRGIFCASRPQGLAHVGLGGRRPSRRGRLPRSISDWVLECRASGGWFPR